MNVESEDGYQCSENFVIGRFNFKNFCLKPLQANLTMKKQNQYKKRFATDPGEFEALNIPTNNSYSRSNLLNFRSATSLSKTSSNSNYIELDIKEMTPCWRSCFELGHCLAFHSGEVCVLLLRRGWLLSVIVYYIILF